MRRAFFSSFRQEQTSREDQYRLCVNWTIRHRPRKLFPARTIVLRLDVRPRDPMVPPLSSAETLRLLEGFGLTGSWTWGFAENEHTWSPGLFTILGVPSGTVRADY